MKVMASTCQVGSSQACCIARQGFIRTCCHQIATYTLAEAALALDIAVVVSASLLLLHCSQDIFW